MSLITAISQVEKEIGSERAGVVRKFRELVDGRKYHEARKYHKQAVKENPNASADIRKYAGVYLKELSRTCL